MCFFLNRENFNENLIWLKQFEEFLLQEFEWPVLVMPER